MTVSCEFDALARLLEEGNRQELRELMAEVGAERIAVWVGRHGGRILSRRSRTFWVAVLGCPPVEPPQLARELWPLV